MKPRWRISASSLIVGLLLILPAAFGIWSGCRNAPITGRRQLVMIPESQEMALGTAAYREVLSQEPLSTNQHYIELVNRVGQRIAAASGRTDYQWEFHVLASEDMNAFALPGGKVAIYEGMLSVCENEAGLAVVMAHEVAHVLARHGGERMSHAVLNEGVHQAIQIATHDKEAYDRQLILAAYGAASQYGVLLPYSRKHESEADYMGLLLMAKAGYDPSEAPRFWERFGRLKSGNTPLEFLSTHPADERRANDLYNKLADALPLYENAPAQYGLGETIPLTAAVD